MTLVLSPRAEELLRDAEDAVVLGRQAEEKVLQEIRWELENKEICRAEFDLVLSALQDSPPEK